ncbi:MAG: hypothetical protein Q9173_006183 [Seirophora scorigena]
MSSFKNWEVPTIEVPIYWLHLAHINLTMSNYIKTLGQFIADNNLWAKLFKAQTPGKRIVPSQSGDNDAKYGLRIDAGQVIGSTKTIYLQVNKEAKGKALAEFVKKNGSHANLATVTIDVNTAAKDQPEAGKKAWESITKQAKPKLG